MKTIKHLDLFSGIGGFALGLKRASEAFSTICFVEINPYARAVLARHFPTTPLCDDVVTLKGAEYRADLITAGFPCQDLSIAGKQRGLQGSRSGLFYHTLRIADEAQATSILYENSPELIWRDDFREVFIKELQERGWGVVWRICSARECGLPHERKRVSMPFASSKKLLPTPIASDAFALKNFSLSTQMKSHKNHQKRLYPYCVDIWSEGSGEIIDLIVEIYEEMMGFPPSWSKSTP